MNAHYTLYGMPASLYTGKARSYLRTQSGSHQRKQNKDCSS